MKKLTKSALRAKNYDEFKKDTLNNLWWYNVPKHWTFKELREFYNHVTNLSPKFHLTKRRTPAILGRKAVK